MTTLWCSIDGRRGDAVPALDRGLQFGDGLFETMAVMDGRVRLLERHLRRLERDAAKLHLRLPDLQMIRGELTHGAMELGQGVLKLLITRGSGERGYAPPRDSTARRVLLAADWPVYPQQVRLMLCETRLASGGSLAGIKHLNRLEQVLASEEVQKNSQYDEGLMLDSNDNVIEATRSNVFFVDDEERLITPRLDQCGVAGVMREVVLELAAGAGVTTAVAQVSLGDVRAARELFVTNSLMGILPVIEFAGRHMEPGTLTRRLQVKLADYLATDASCAG